MRSGAVLLLTFLTLSALPLAPATSHPLEVEAGLSVAAYNGAPASVGGKAFGGTAPYAYAWTHLGSGARFADPAAAATTFDTAGLAAGPVDLTLTVTDGLGATASDTVKILVESALLLEQDVVITAGAPDEILLAAPLDRKLVNFAVPAGMARLDGALSWPEAEYDLDLVVIGPGGATSGAQGETPTANPERVSIPSPPAGGWQAQVKPFSSGPTTARLRIEAFPAGVMPTAVAPPSRPYGTLDAQTLTASATGGTAPYSFAWDADGDGRYETPGGSVTLSLPSGTHQVAFKVTDAAGWEVGGASTLSVRAAENALRIACGNEPGALWAMEFAQSGGTCWVHGGHHTYALAGQQATLRGFEGFAFAVEQQFAPSVPPLDDPTAWAMHVETSVDGVAWTEQAVLQGAFGVDVPFDVTLPHVDARFVRLFPENHARFDQTGQFAANHHPKGFFVDSRITVEGELPS